jgi:hypothetical protein
MRASLQQDFISAPRGVRRQVPLLYFNILCIGALLTLAIQARIQDNFEKRYFEDLAKTVVMGQSKPSEDSVILGTLHLTHQLLESRSQLLAKTTAAAIPLCSFSPSLTQDLLTAGGACGSYSDVLCELLQCLGFRTRIAQMKVGGHFGGHIVTETMTGKGWVVLDAMFDQYFITPTGKLASFKEVSRCWDFYRQQTKKGYDSDYCYSDVRYTNWNKLPVIMPLCKKTLTLFLGEQRVNELSLRPLFLRKFRLYCYVLLLLDLLIVIATLKRFYRRLPDPPFPRASYQKLRSLKNRPGV